VCKGVLNLLKAAYLRLMKLVVQRITVVKSRMNDGGNDVVAVLESRSDQVCGLVV